jgi:hypothetical protein
MKIENMDNKKYMATNKEVHSKERTLAQHRCEDPRRKRSRNKYSLQNIKMSQRI